MPPMKLVVQTCLFGLHRQGNRIFMQANDINTPPPGGPGPTLTASAVPISQVLIEMAV